VVDGPVFSKWSYNSPYLPRRIHNKLSAVQECFTWLEDCPYAAADNSYIGRSAAEATALVIGLLLHDICAHWFSHRDPDEPAPTNIPDYVLSSVVEFTMVAETLTPLCQDMLDFIKTKVVIDPVLVALSKRGVVAEVQPTPPSPNIAPVIIPAVAAIPNPSVSNSHVPEIPSDPAVETGTRRSARRITKTKKAEDIEQSRTQPRRQTKAAKEIPVDPAKPQRGSRRK
jgi:hypothetical protein